MSKRFGSRHWRLIRLTLTAALATTLLGSVSVVQATSTATSNVDHIFVIMLENHSAANVIDNVDANGTLTAPYMTQLAHKFGMATQYYGVTHPSMPNYVAAISGSNWFVNNDNPATRFNHLNLVDQLEAKNLSWGAYMESMPADDPLIDFWPDEAHQLYVSKHNPFVLFDDIRNSPSRVAKIKPYDKLKADLNSANPPAFVWISPNQCHDLHGGVSEVDPTGGDGTPCPYGTTTPTQDAKDLYLIHAADRFVAGAVHTITTSKAWTGNSVLFILTDENDFVFANKSIDSWETADGCCDSPMLPNGYAFTGSHGTPDGNVLACPDNAALCTYGGGLVPAIIVARKGSRTFTSDTPYNHYSLLRTIEEKWGLGYLGNAADSVQVHSMNEFLVP